MKKFISLVGVIVLGILLILMYWSTHLYYKAQNIDNTDNKIKLLENAKRLSPINDSIYKELGRAYFEKGYKTLDEENPQKTALEKSVRYFHRSLRLNPAYPDTHFWLGQSLMYLNYISPSTHLKFNEAYKKSAILAGYHSQIYFEVGKLFFSRWPKLSEEDKNFTIELINKLLKEKKAEHLEAFLEIWNFYVQDYGVLKQILPEDARIYRTYAHFLAERSLSLQERHQALAKAEFLDFQQSESANKEGVKNFLYFRSKEKAKKYFSSCLNTLNRINFYQNLTAGKLIDVKQYENLKKSALLHLGKCHLSDHQNIEEAKKYFLSYLSLEDNVSALNELESYLKDQKFIKSGPSPAYEDLANLSFQLVLMSKQNRYQEIMRIGRNLEQSFISIPQKNHADYVHILEIVGEAYQKSGYVYDAGDIFLKALEVYPDSLTTLVRYRNNLNRLNSQEKLDEINLRIKKLITPNTVLSKSLTLSRNKKFRRNLTLEGKEVELFIDFEITGENIIPLISILFNGRVVWEDFLDESLIELTVPTQLEKNLLEIVALNTNAVIRKIEWK